MKKILLATTAVVALSTVSAEAFAADKIALSLGGFMREYITMTNHDEVAATSGVGRGSNIGQFSNNEIYFRGSTTLDNGLSVSVDHQMETSYRNTTGQDVLSMTVSSDAMGAITLGATPHAGDDFLTRAPQASNMDWGDGSGLVALSGTAASVAWAASSTSDITAAGDKTVKIKYVSPNFSGVNVFASWNAAEGTAGSHRDALGSAIEDGKTYGIAYGGEIGGTSVSADVTHISADTNTEVNHLGVSVGMAGFTIGGGYSEFNDTRTASAVTDGNAYEIGVSYATGPYSVSAGYNRAVNNGTVATTGDNKDTNWQLAGSYDLGAGVVLAATYFSNKADGEGTGTTVATGKSTKVSGLIAGIEVGF